MAEASLRERRQSLMAQGGLRGHAFCRAYSAEADAWLTALADKASAGRPQHLALLAVGGYGRGELCPFSDLDLVLVHRGREDVATLADAIWYPVWDEGVHLDHSVRRPAEVLNAAAADSRVAIGLLDARLVWGDPDVALPLIDRAREQWRSHVGRWLPVLAQQMEERRHAHGDVAYLLEPDVKESHGGLRDAHLLGALSAGAARLGDVVDLSGLGKAATVLTEVRVELHRRARRALDRVVLQEQDDVALSLGYADADALMGAVAEAGRTLAWMCAEAWQRRSRWEPGGTALRRWSGQRRRTGGARAAGNLVEVEPGIVVADGEVSLADGEVSLADGKSGGTDPSLALRLAAVAAERGEPLSRGTLEHLARSMTSPEGRWPTDRRRALVRLLCQGHRAIDVLEAFDQYGLLVRLVPEWALVRNKPQRNAYHRFTVDRHLLEAAANGAELAGRVTRPDLLVVACLLHDIGKGSSGDHTEAGVVLVHGIGERLGFDQQDVETLVALCRLHLLLADTATRRDLEDPSTVEKVAREVGLSSTLRLLWALTEADGLATGPAAWGPWKAGLVADLVQRVERYLDGRASEVADAPDSRGPSRHGARALQPLVDEVRRTGRPAAALDPPRLAVAAPDRPGLLAAVTGTLALFGLDVRSADVAAEDGVALEVFIVEAARGDWPDIGRLRSDVEAVLAGRVPLADRLAAKSADYARARRRSTPYPVVPTVAIHDDASATSTVVEVGAQDELGLLHRVTQALFDCGLDVVSARVSTVGDAVVDAFYVREAGGQKVTGPEQLDRLRHALLLAVHAD